MGCALCFNPINWAFTLLDFNIKVGLVFSYTEEQASISSLISAMSNRLGGQYSCFFVFVFGYTGKDTTTTKISQKSRLACLTLGAELCHPTG